MIAILAVLSILSIVFAVCLGQDQQQVILQYHDFAANDLPVYPDNRVYHAIEIEDAYYGRRNVSYFVSQAGLAVIDGDVVYGIEKELLANRYDPKNLDRVYPAAFSVRESWPDATVKYKYDSDGTQTLLSDIVPVAISRWQTVAPYLIFPKQSPNSATPQNGVLTISANAGDGCHSDIGYRNAPMTMNLQRDNPTSCVCCPNQATHEFGHLLGAVVYPLAAAICFLICH